MAIGEDVGFWSYTHRDNDLDHGRVARLAQDISDEYELQTGDALEMFVDNRSIKWGNEWREHIGLALKRTVFFIAIITPLYLRSNACRREFDNFASNLRANKHSHILLPILYVETPAITDPDYQDPIAQLVRRTQYQDLRKVRLSETNSSEYRRVVHTMAARIIDIGESR
jgi:hypothetical protein